MARSAEPVDAARVIDDASARRHVAHHAASVKKQQQKTPRLHEKKTPKRVTQIPCVA